MAGLVWEEQRFLFERLSARVWRAYANSSQAIITLIA